MNSSMYARSTIHHDSRRAAGALAPAINRTMKFQGRHGPRWDGMVSQDHDPPRQLITTSIIVRSSLIINSFIGSGMDLMVHGCYPTVPPPYPIRAVLSQGKNIHIGKQLLITGKRARQRVYPHEKNSVKNKISTPNSTNTCSETCHTSSKNHRSTWQAHTRVYPHEETKRQKQNINAKSNQHLLGNMPC